MVNSRVIRNYITPSIVKRLGLPYRQKLEPYTLVTILGDPVLYKDGIINLETRLVKVSIKGQSIIINFNILLLG
jgi:phosphoribosylaminoimidazole-succinocarboxamide synthase